MVILYSILLGIDQFNIGEKSRKKNPNTIKIRCRCGYFWPPFRPDNCSKRMNRTKTNFISHPIGFPTLTCLLEISNFSDVQRVDGKKGVPNLSSYFHCLRIRFFSVFGLLCITTLGSFYVELIFN